MTRSPVHLSWVLLSSLSVIPLSAGSSSAASASSRISRQPAQEGATKSPSPRASGPDAAQSAGKDSSGASDQEQASPETQDKSGGVSMVSSALRSVSAGLTREEARFAILERTGDAPSAECRRVFVSTSGSLVDKWRPIGKTGEKSKEVLDVRTGFEAGVLLSVDEATSVRVGHLTRARIGRMNTGGEGSTASRIVIELTRGSVEVTPGSDRTVNVLTPDGLTVLREAARVSFDAVKGTRVSSTPKPTSPVDQPRTNTEKP